MLREGFIETNDFVEVTSADREQTLMPSLVSADNITNFFEEYDSWQASGQTIKLLMPVMLINMLVMLVPTCTADADGRGACCVFGHGPLTFFFFFFSTLVLCHL